MVYPRPVIYRTKMRRCVLRAVARNSKISMPRLHERSFAHKIDIAVLAWQSKMTIIELLANHFVLPS